MFSWLTRSKKAEYLPNYSALKANPSKGLPSDLEAQENTESFGARQDALQHELLDGSQRPPIDAPLFTVLLESERRFVCLALPDNGGPCVPVFSTPFRAADYVRALLDRGSRSQYLCSSPTQFLQMLPELKGSGVEWITIDRCPRCSILTTIGTSSIRTPDDAVVLWAVHKATELARSELYLAYALESARAGKLELARDVGIEAVGHVTMEDPRLHFLLGEVAIGLGDGRLLEEAKAFLQHFKMDSWLRKLVQDEESGASDFALGLNT